MKYWPFVQVFASHNLHSRAD